MNRVLVNLYDKLDSLRIIDIHLFEGKRSIVQKNNINMMIPFIAPKINPMERLANFVPLDVKRIWKNLVSTLTINNIKTKIIEKLITITTNVLRSIKANIFEDRAR
tara:strand:- start:2527 stop:2844 length:318 start_codon:yes stop_codon:yes gene_type:complete